MVKTRNKAEKENAFESKSLARKKTQRLRMVPANRQPLVEKEDDGNMKPSSTFLAENGPNNNSRSKREKLVIENDKGEEAGIVLVSDDLSDYEKVRLKNIAERQKMFENLKKDMMSLKKDMTAPNSGKPKQSHIVARRRRGTSLGYSSRAERVVTRSRTSLGSSESEEMYSGKKRLYEEMSDDDDEGEEEANAKKRARVRNPNPSMWATNPNVDILQPEDVTEEMLANVAERYSDKEYAQSGTTCHQCRQKTTDVKTVCRSGNCAGVRGYFCGVCLLHRYGQDAREALKDPNWMCPPCLDVCNCSICRNRMGKGATGPITWLAQAKGFSSVKDYLESLAVKKEEGADNEDGDEGDEQEPGAEDIDIKYEPLDTE